MEKIKEEMMDECEGEVDVPFDHLVFHRKDENGEYKKLGYVNIPPVLEIPYPKEENLPEGGTKMHVFMFCPFCGKEYNEWGDDESITIGIVRGNKEETPNNLKDYRKKRRD